VVRFKYASSKNSDQGDDSGRARQSECNAASMLISARTDTHISFELLLVYNAIESLDTTERI
jgi:hypothetical protein